MLRETRAVALTAAAVENRANDGMTFTGHAAVFDQRTWIGPQKWGFYEEVDRGFFRDVLDDDAAFLVNHDPNIVLARNGNTMSLEVDSLGLKPTARFDPNDTDAVKWAGRVQRGDVSKMSFAFTVAEEKWSEDTDGNEVRTLLRADKLFDVSLVTYPAYDGTDAAMRSSAAEVVKRHRGYDPTIDVGKRAGDAMKALADAAEGAKDGNRTFSRELLVLRTRLIAARHGLEIDKRAADDTSIITQALGWFSAIDSIVDEAQEALAMYLGVPNPDEDDPAA